MRLKIRQIDVPEKKYPRIIWMGVTDKDIDMDTPLYIGSKSTLRDWIFNTENKERKFPVLIRWETTDEVKKYAEISAIDGRRKIVNRQALSNGKKEFVVPFKR